MKTLLSIIAALALMFAFSLPAMANNYGDDIDNSTAIGGGVSGSAVANDNSTAIDDSTLNNMFNDNRRYDDDHNAVAVAILAQMNEISAGNDIKEELNDSGDIDIDRSIDDFAGIANANLNTGALNNQAIQNTIAVRYLVIN
jgi:uridylate kinase